MTRHFCLKLYMHLPCLRKVEKLHQRSLTKPNYFDIFTMNIIAGIFSSKINIIQWISRLLAFDVCFISIFIRFFSTQSTEKKIKNSWKQNPYIAKYIFFNFTFWSGERNRLNKHHLRVLRNFTIALLFQPFQ